LQNLIAVVSDEPLIWVYPILDQMISKGRAEFIAKVVQTTEDCEKGDKEGEKAKNNTLPPPHEKIHCYYFL